MRAVLPSLTQLWKKLGATETPIASLVMPVEACAALLAITRNVPKSKTRRCCVYLGSEANSLQIENEKRGKEIRNAIKKCNNNKLRMYVKRKSSKDQLIYAQRGSGEGVGQRQLLLMCFCTYYKVHWLIVWPGPSKKVTERVEQIGRRAGGSAKRGGGSGKIAGGRGLRFG